ncbi:hypothetical protein GR925_08525 [Streptomyces sp. HUCO-GS316]|uniref:hypothetical protein n=1 Tax=Streptomyces sp. HUCO-GS316 TaxID=2692198 RepID=UPI00136A843D|nr:hypothetical protein [Streptomyces sp. HUCO-GS316]MXM63491.1 hypothetical protein [Streptomyces sp. HUCO-GS316]
MSGWQPDRKIPSGAGQSPFDTVTRLSEMISRLPREQREAVENAVMDLLATNPKYRNAYQKSPESMPHATRFANNAFERQALREGASVTESSRNERVNSDASNNESARTDSAGTGAPRLDPLPDTGRLPDFDEARAVVEAMNAAGNAVRAQDAQQAELFRARWERSAPAQRSSSDQVGPTVESATTADTASVASLTATSPVTPSESSGNPLLSAEGMAALRSSVEPSAGTVSRPSTAQSHQPAVAQPTAVRQGPSM